MENNQSGEKTENAMPNEINVNSTLDREKEKSVLDEKMAIPALNQKKENSAVDEKKEDLASEEAKSVKPENRGTKRLQEVSDITQLPQELKEMFTALKCKLCNVEVTSPVIAYTHYEGKVHLKNVNAYMKRHYNVESALKKKKTVIEPLKCEVCDLELSSDIVYKQHIAGKQHKKNLRRNKELLPPVSKVEIDPTGRFGIGKAFYKEIDETKSITDESPLFCDLCNVFVNTEQQMTFHKQGQKHTKNKAKQKSTKQDADFDSTRDSKEHYNEENVWQASPSEKQNSL